MIIVSLFVCLSLYAQKGKHVMCKWHKNGDSELNLPDEGYDYFKKGKFFYYLSNDKDYLYVDIKTDDSGVQNRMLQEGMILWISMDDKKSKNTGVHFPIGVKNLKGRGAGFPEGSGEGSIINPNSPIALANTIEFIGFSDAEPKRIPARNIDNFNGLVRYDKEGNLFYHIAIPITRLPVSSDLRREGAMPFTIGIEYGATPVTGRPAGGGIPAAPSGRPAGVPAGGGSRGGRPGGVPGGGMMPPGSGTSQSVVPPVILWISDIILATER